MKILSIFRLRDKSLSFSAFESNAPVPQKHNAISKLLSHNLLSELSRDSYNIIHSSSLGFYALTTVNPFHSKLNNTMYKTNAKINQVIEALNDMQTDVHIKLSNTIKKKANS